MVLYGLILYKMVQKGPKRFKMVHRKFQIGPILTKLYRKITAVGATAAGKTSVRNNLKI